MQPVSIVGYGAALIGGGLLRVDIVGPGVFTSLVAATLLGTAAGFLLRPRIDPPRVVLLIRSIAAVAAILLFASIFY